MNVKVKVKVKVETSQSQCGLEGCSSRGGGHYPSADVWRDDALEGVQAKQSGTEFQGTGCWYN